VGSEIISIPTNSVWDILIQTWRRCETSRLFRRSFT